MLRGSGRGDERCSLGGTAYCTCAFSVCTPLGVSAVCARGFSRGCLACLGHPEGASIVCSSPLDASSSWSGVFLALLLEERELHVARGHRGGAIIRFPVALRGRFPTMEENTRRPAVFFCGLTSDSPCLPCPGIRTTCAQKCMKLVVLLERQWIPAAHVCFVEVENC